MESALSGLRSLVMLSKVFTPDIDPKGRTLTLTTHQDVRQLNQQSAATRAQIAATRADIANTRADIQARQIDEYRDKVVQWLSTTDPSSNHYQACKKHLPGTGQWITNHDEFEHWKLTKNSLLWLYGKRKSIPYKDMSCQKCLRCVFYTLQSLLNLQQLSNLLFHSRCLQF